MDKYICVCIYIYVYIYIYNYKLAVRSFCSVEESLGRNALTSMPLCSLRQVDCGEFQDPQVFCTRESNPYCGSDGQTYGNKCAFCKAMV